MNVPINAIYSEIITNDDNYKKWGGQRNENYSIYRDKWTYNPRNNIVEHFPLNLDIEPTNACNLKCPFCYRTIAINDGSSQFEELGNMTLKLYHKIINQIVENDICMVPAIKLTHRGEPLLNRDIVEMVSIAKQAGAIDVIMNTNATLLTTELSENLFKAGLDKLLISVDSPVKDEYEKIRVGASYDKVIENIQNAVTIRNKMKAFGTLIRIGMVVTDETKPYIDIFIDKFKNLADVVSFNKVCEETDVDLNGNFTTKAGFCKNVQNAEYTCSQLWQRMTINWNGDAEICCQNYKQEYKLGNVNETSIKEIWNSEAFNKVRDAHWNNQWWKIGQCRKCTMPFITPEDE